ncbi:MAG: hypothetical protein CL840_09275 [Crocinitomicaceae bacterium]|nr:hypothetical protein [Crocinitomicaceae bacterium]|tara:strand:+ start:656 stop:973 length:318 start_codon:yes stop_codon:yes gene_type:complete
MVASGHKVVFLLGTTHHNQCNKCKSRKQNSISRRIDQKGISLTCPNGENAKIFHFITEGTKHSLAQAKIGESEEQTNWIIGFVLLLEYFIGCQPFYLSLFMIFVS